ncbi:MAG: hypothetical protein RJQ09_16300 [Cyclobacteriaceae bacterium]
MKKTEFNGMLKMVITVVILIPLVFACGTDDDDDNDDVNPDDQLPTDTPSVFDNDYIGVILTDEDPWECQLELFHFQSMMELQMVSILSL